MRNLIGFLLFLSVSNFMWAQSQQQISESEVRFSIKNAGLLVEGSLGDVKGSIQFKPETAKQAKMAVSVNVNALKTGSDLRDKHLKKKEYFDAEMFPEIKMVSKFFGITETGYKGYFVLSLKGVSKDVVIPFTYTKQGQTEMLTGSFVLNRLDYGIGGKSLVMGDEVKITIEVKLN
ncbi:MAG: YceI family protein [Bacteroidia bacterium]|nr:YceI family protein [Bacteroidia bacterium]MCF8426961.1 YceI family protein [Bacteroidia bacterium]MCF8447600.1 YceI family protein [Bacteroidia bacterium]